MDNKRVGIDEGTEKDTIFWVSLNNKKGDGWLPPPFLLFIQVLHPSFPGLCVEENEESTTYYG